MWSVTDSKLAWLERNPHEWTHTRLVFELTPVGDGTAVRFTHEGHHPEMECFARVSEAWNLLIKEWLHAFITDGTPRPPPPGLT